MTPLMALVVEDDPIQAEIFTKALEAAGYTVEHIADGDRAVAYLQDHAPYLIVLDLHLPGTAGDDILRAIRSNPATTQTRVLLATADPRLAETVQAESDLVLLKPVSYIQLRDLARRMRPNEGG